MNTYFCVVLLGPTAVGKSHFVYEQLDVPRHLISADSMQVYKHFDIVTDTPTSSQLQQSPHTGINERSPSQDYSVSDFLERADTALEQSQKGRRVPIVVGGTGLYLKAFLYGLDDMPSRDPELRKRLREQANRHGRTYLHDKLRKIDPEAADNIHPNDRKRVIRALEIFEQTGKTKTELTNSSSRIRDCIQPLILGLTRPREELHQRIRKRVERMVERGGVEEIRRLRSEWDVSRTLRQAIGFESVSGYLDGRWDKQKMKERMVKKTKEFARKQMNWFQRFPVTEWYHPEKDQKELIETVESKRTQKA